jgi:hypothetical protein
MKVRKFSEFINEEFNDTPEQYIETALRIIKKKIDKIFEFQEDGQEEEYDGNEKTIDQAKEDSKKKDGDKLTFKDLGVRLESSEISKYSKLHDSLTVKFTDDSALYNLYIMIELSEGIPKDKEKDFSHEDIKKCFIKFKKYDIDTFEIIGQITKNVDIKKIDEDLLVGLKIDLDKAFSDGDDEEFEYETE